LTEAVRQILAAKADHLPAIVWGNHALRRYRQRVFLTPAHPPRLDGMLRWCAAPQARVDLGPPLGELCWVAQNGGIDPQRLPQQLTVRRRAGGETLKPAATAATKSVQHLCQSHGVLPWMRDALPLVFAGDTLLAVGDLWSDARWCAPPGQTGFAVEWRRGPIII
jgi:tRNA(Ile)-lysidine synthase